MMTPSRLFRLCAMPCVTAPIVAALRELYGPSQPQARRCTIVLFSHRLLAFPQADIVVVLDHGRILEQGTHAELARNGGLYAHLAALQFDQVEFPDDPGVARGIAASQ